MINNQPLHIFHKLYYELWGRAPVQFVGKFEFYACIVDDFYKYIWLILLNAFLLFQKVVDRRFNKKINVFQSNSSNEFANNEINLHL